jgi:DNA-directed RNA polymerase subunit beta'
MRTFHIGGTASKVTAESKHEAKNSGLMKYQSIRHVVNHDGDIVVLNRNGFIIIEDERGREKERYPVVPGAKIKVKEGGRVTPGTLLVEWDPFTTPILTEVSGTVVFRDIVQDVTLRDQIDEVTGLVEHVIIEDQDNKLQPRVSVKAPGGEAPSGEDALGETRGRYMLPVGAHLLARDNAEVFQGDIIAKIPRESTKTKDITGGLPRVAELFEARRPKDASEISKIDGVVDFGPSVRGKRCVLIKDQQTALEEEHLIPIGKHVIVFKGDFVKKGQQLTEGPIDPHEILEICGPQELQEHLVNEVQEVYRLQGVTINDKHIETIVRQMLRKVRITEPGDTQFLWGEQIDKIEFEAENERVDKMGGKPAEAQPVLLGITKASLETESFLSAASFQDTTRVLTEAATMSRVDYLRGFKENVIMGHIIPAGTGYDYHRKAKLKPLVELEDLPPQEEVAVVESPLLG